MSNVADMVADFHQAFNVEKVDELDEKNLALRYSLLKEEFDEYRAATFNASTEVVSGKLVSTINQIEMLDALADMVYVIYGTAELFGWDLDEALRRVHTSNMSKLGEDGRPIINGENGVYDETKPKGKVLKSKNYEPPMLEDLV